LCVFLIFGPIQQQFSDPPRSFFFFFFFFFFCSDFTFSDQSLKEHIEDLSGATEALRKLKGCKFRWRLVGSHMVVDNEDAVPGSVRKTLGFIAQEVSTVIPEAVSQTGEGWLAVDYQALVPYFASALSSHLVDLERLKDESEELERLRQSVQLLSSKLPSSFNKSSPPPSPISTPKRSKGKRFSFSKKPWMKFPWMFAIFVPLGLLLAAVIVGLAVGLPMNHKTPPPPYRAVNYINNGDFEDPTGSGWSGTASITSYSDSVDPPGSTMRSLAAFDPGQRFLRLDTSHAQDSFTQRVSGLSGGNRRLKMSAWVFLPRRADAVQISIAVNRSLPGSGSIVICSAYSTVNASRIMTWQQLTAELICATEETDSFTASIQAFGNAVTAAVDVVQLVNQDQPEPASTLKFMNEESLLFPAQPSGITANIVLNAPSNRFLVGCVDVTAYPRQADVAVVRVEPYGLRDYSYGEDNGAARIPLLKQTNTTTFSDWIASDSLGRVYAVGKMQVGYMRWVAAIARLTSSGDLDTSFGRAGFGMVPLFSNVSAGDSTAVFVAVGNNGNSIYVLSSFDANSTMVAWRLDGQGVLDPSFGFGHGFFHFSLNISKFAGAAISTSGHTFVVSTQDISMTVTKYLPTGQVDLSYGDNGTSFSWIIAASAAPIVHKSVFSPLVRPVFAFVSLWSTSHRLTDRMEVFWCAAPYFQLRLTLSVLS
jgi:hypothetical protein